RDGVLARGSVLYREVFAGRLFFFFGYRQHPTLHSFPTRRSSDLDAGAEVGRIVENDRGRARARTAGRRAVEVAGQDSAVVVVGQDVGADVGSRGAGMELVAGGVRIADRAPGEAGQGARGDVEARA